MSRVKEEINSAGGLAALGDKTENAFKIKEFFVENLSPTSKLRKKNRGNSIRKSIIL
jgi:hypothetical protein